jgi:serine/threonine-protein kinase
MAFEIGQKVGGFEFLAALEDSATGVSYKVRNLLADRLEVLKVVPRELQEGQERVERFLREAKVHARLDHPNIAAFYNVMEVGTKLVMTSELLEGTSLEQRLKSGALETKQAVDYALQALAGLAYAHSEGVVHRDVTPGHLVINSRGTVKITGFGLAKLAAGPQLTQPGLVIGSVHYMSPEQVKGAQVDARSDVYSMGAVLYEAVTGKKPFDYPSQFQVFMAHINARPVPPGELRPGVPSDLSWIIMTALAKEPAERFQSARQFADALQRVVPSLEFMEPQETTQATAPAVEVQSEKPPVTDERKPAAQELAVLSHLSATQASTIQANTSRAGEAGPVGRELEGSQPQAATTSTANIAAAVAQMDARNAEQRPVPQASPLEGSSQPAASTPTAVLTQPELPAEREISAPARNYEPTVQAAPAHASKVASEADAPRLKSTPTNAPRGTRKPSSSWLPQEPFPGWRSKDVIAIGTLTFVVVAAVFFTFLTYMSR